jgi:hypothetical protein
MLLSRVSLLAPPYNFPVPFGSGRPPLGTIIVVDLADGATARLAVTLHRSAPWCPVCVLLDSSPLTLDLYRSLRRLPSSSAVIEGPPAGSPPDSDRIVHAVRTRPEPTAGQLARYVGRRATRPDLRLPLKACFDCGLAGRGPPPSLRRWLSRKLQKFGPLTARDWGAVAQLLPVLRSIDLSLDRYAYEYGKDPRTVRSRLHRYAGVTAGEARTRVGWEWLLEAVLRKWGYVDVGKTADQICLARSG